MKNSLPVILIIILLHSCNDNKTRENKNVTAPVTKDSVGAKPSPADSLKTAPVSITETTKAILTLLQNKDHKSFSSYIHPVEGIRFSPYACIDTATDHHFSATEFSSLLAQKNKKLIWGSYDGSGDDIKLTVDGYFQRFVYDADFLNAEKTSLNKMIGGGNSLNNLPKIYPDHEFTESYFSGFDKKLGGMDWVVLRLVYKRYEGKPYLVGVVHDQWTI
ncbi:hypothetical protein [Ferruginibacter sp. HRS2-29]|uniref:hypothetical protein n=1 Tax=Ferruginibacter sp. HRS2-29 TaxID=2487334 RepID=UPI0020CE8DC1|nr:hypothetical protein [Ferruginibacter sp. HRS2-29]MCP9752394.1 hypothetical protein [Ferruginibacter sp. HRS2-29]